jgi:DNA-binding transcriptional ArsR family regulator
MRAFIASKRGRPRQSAHDMTAANDNAPDRTDRGTPELQLKRAAWARGVAAEAVTHPLDLLLAHGLIEAAEQRAGWHYAALYRRLVGRTEMSYGRLYAGLAGESRGRPTDIAGDPAADEAVRAEAQRQFRAAQAALRSEGAVVAGITERLAVFGAFPDWLLSQDATALRARGLLRKGLRQLAEAFRRETVPVDSRILQGSSR